MINDFILINKEAFSKTKNTIINNWQILFMGFIYSLIGMAAFFLLAFIKWANRYIWRHNNSHS